MLNTVIYRIKQGDSGVAELDSELTGCATLFNTVGEGLHCWLTAHKAQFDFYQVIPHGQTIKPEQYKRIESDRPIKHNGFKSVAKQWEPALKLSTHTLCVCEETGIEFAVELPHPTYAGFTMLHPFAIWDNVKDFIKTYQKHGLPFGKLENQVLAGMLLTTLKHKQFLASRNYVLVNQRIRQCNKNTLISALNYFHRASSRIGLPMINLEAEGSPDFQIIQYMKICRGEDETVQVHHIQESKRNKISVKVYQTASQRQTAEIKQETKSALFLLEKLHKAMPEVKQVAVSQIKERLQRLAVLSDKGKDALVKDVRNLFHGHELADTLSLLILSIDNSAIAADALSFSQEFEIEQQPTNGPVDFMAMLKGNE